MADDSYQMPDKTASASTKMGSEPARGALVTERVEIRKAENGGYIATCFKKPKTEGRGGDMPHYVPPKDYAFGSLGEAQAFLAKEFGEGAAPATADLPADNPAPRPAPPAAAASQRPMMGMAAASGPRY